MSELYLNEHGFINKEIERKYPSGESHAVCPNFVVLTPDVFMIIRNSLYYKKLTSYANGVEA